METVIIYNMYNMHTASLHTVIPLSKQGYKIHFIKGKWSMASASV
jgi:hypothetical protein